MPKLPKSREVPMLHTMFKLFLMALLLLPLSSFSQSQSAANTTPEWNPVSFLGETSSPLSVASDHRLDFGKNGTIELGIALGTDSSAQIPLIQTLAAHASKQATRFEVQIRGGGTEIGLFNGSQYQGVPFDFREGGYHAVAVSTTGNRSTITVDGNRIGEITIGYSQHSRLPFHIGGNRHVSVTNPFSGYISHVRLWDKPLSSDHLRNNFNQYGLPSAESGGSDGLVLYTLFSNLERSILFTKPVTAGDILSTKYVGSRTGNGFVDLIPEEFELISLDILFKPRIVSLNAFLADSTGNIISLPIRGSEQGDKQSVYFAKDETIIGISGTHGDSINNIQLHLSSGRISPVIGGKDGPVAFHLSIPEGARFEGFAGTVDQVLTSIALVYTTEPDINLDLSGRWTNEILDEPRRNDTLMRKRGKVDQLNRVPLHGNFTRQKVYSIRYSKRGHELLFANNIDLSVVPYLHKNRNTYRNTSKNSTLVIQPDGSIVIDGQRFRKVTPYEVLGKDFVAFGGTFNQDSQQKYYKRSYIGYDINKLGVSNFQLRDGIKRPLFRIPALNSKDYTPSSEGSGKTIGHGLFRFGDSEGQQSSYTETASNAEEHHNSWKFGFGESIGISGIGAAGFNANYSRSRKDASSRESMYTLTRSYYQKYSIVLDEARIALADDFENRIREVGEKLRAGIRVDFQREIIDPYGTHYAHAITYGCSELLELS